MGSDRGGEDERPVHQVVISRGFEMGKYEVTQAQWQAVMRHNPSGFVGPTRPVESVSWDAVQEFIKRLNEMDEEYLYRLPTEAEWEYACRAGSTTEYHFGNDAGQLEKYAWYADNAGGETHPVGQREPNKWGLYDMHGNVWEWVQDEWHGNYEGAPKDGSPWEDGSGSSRVDRGGSWNYFARLCRSAYRVNNSPDARYDNLGLRLVRTAK
jgi:formylglycine-generating enzyme required for sulfatase activity